MELPGAVSDDHVAYHAFSPDDIKSRLPFDSSTLDYYSRHILYRLGKHREQDSKTQNEKTWNGSNGSSQGSTISLNEWMTRLPSELRSKPIWSLTLPGIVSTFNTSIGMTD